MKAFQVFILFNIALLCATCGHQETGGSSAPEKKDSLSSANTKVDEALMNFISDISNVRNLAAYIDSTKGFCIIGSGPGVDKVVTSGRTVQDLMSLNEFLLYASDGALLPSSYTAVNDTLDKCDISDKGREGHYISTKPNVNTLCNMQGYAPKYELLIKYMTKTGEEHSFSIIVSEAAGRLLIASFEGIDCGA